ncbi:MAG: cardiolipin synthase [Synergistaceae bacterium]|jgi:cardiolipin synthase|nr:cardiolipin synthase [Synergistaceae bacterium]
MNKKHPSLKWLAMIAVAAFVLGLLPFLFLSLHETGVAGFVAVIWRLVWRGLMVYAPHILTIYMIIVAALIFFEGRNPDRTVMWLLTLALLPVVGIVLYLLLGPDLKRFKMRRLFRPTKSYPSANSPHGRRTSVRVRKTTVLAFRNSSAEIMERGKLRMLIDGDETFTCIKKELAKARRYINIEYFIFKDDRLGREIADILEERASAGVKVRMMTDGVGSWKLGRRLVKELQDSGVDFRTFMPVSFPFFRSRLNFRNHRKIIIIDGDAAFTGGLNVGAEYLGEGPLGHWRDTHALFRGDSVKAFNAIFLEDWRIASGRRLSPDSAEFAASDPTEAESMPFLPMQIVPGGSSTAWRSIQQMYFLLIAEAQKRIWITTPYLAPDSIILEALQASALAGVDVRILIPYKSDHFMAYWAGRSNIEELLRAGARIWMYKKGFIHAKTLLMDNLIASLGTANLDNRSLEINFEVQAFIYDEQACASLERQFASDLKDSEECFLSKWERRGIVSKVMESMGRLWSSQI